MKPSTSHFTDHHAPVYPVNPDKDHKTVQQFTNRTVGATRLFVQDATQQCDQRKNQDRLHSSVRVIVSDFTLLQIIQGPDDREKEDLGFLLGHTAFLQTRYILENKDLYINFKSVKSSKCYLLQNIMLMSRWSDFEKLEIIQRILEHKNARLDETKLDINAVNKGETALVTALFMKDGTAKEKIIYHLLIHKADLSINYRTQRASGTLLHVAIDQYKTLNASPKTQIILIQLNTLFNIILIILKFSKKNDLEVGNILNKSPHRCACEAGLTKIAQLIQMRYEECNDPLSEQLIGNYTPVFQLPNLVHTHQAQNVKFLKVCIIDGDLAKVQALLSASETDVVDLNIGFFDPDTKSVVTILLNLFSIHRRPIREQEKYLQIAEYLLINHKAKIDLTLTNSFGETVLHMIMSKGKFHYSTKRNYIQLVLDKSEGVVSNGKLNDIDAVDSEGHTVLFNAIVEPTISVETFKIIASENPSLTIRYTTPVAGGTILHQLIYWCAGGHIQDTRIIRSSKPFKCFQIILESISERSILNELNAAGESVLAYAENIKNVKDSFGRTTNLIPIKKQLLSLVSCEKKSIKPLDDNLLSDQNDQSFLEPSQEKKMKMTSEVLITGNLEKNKTGKQLSPPIISEPTQSFSSEQTVSSEEAPFQGDDIHVASIDAGGFFDFAFDPDSMLTDIFN